MKLNETRHILRSSLLAMIILWIPAYIQAQTMETARIPSDEDIKKITAAIPVAPAVKPAEPRKVLVFSMSHKYFHHCIPVGKRAFKILGKKTGAFEAVVSDNIAMFEPEKLSQFDAVILNNAYVEMFMTYTDIAKGYFGGVDETARKKIFQYDQKLKDSFAAYIKSGKGLVVLHAAVASFENWPEYGRMIGARFDGHPWKDINVTFKIDRPRHILTRAFKGKSFVLNDEIYQVKDPYSRENLDVLVSIDSNGTDMSLEGINRKDRDFGITWIKNYGRGRIFYCALGHDPALFWNPMVLKHYLDGIQYAVGDLKLKQ